MKDSATVSLLRRIAASVERRLDLTGKGTGMVRGGASALVQHITPAELAGLVATLVAQYEQERAASQEGR